MDIMKMCIITHTSSKWANFTTAIIILITILVIYVMYAIIIVKYMGMKRRFLLMKQKNRGMQAPNLKITSTKAKKVLGISSLKNNTLSKKVQGMFEVLKNVKYVLYVITSFTLCWHPWVILDFYEIAVHEFGILKELELVCGQSENMKQAKLNQSDDFKVQACFHHLMSDGLPECEVPGTKEEVCRSLQTHLHNYFVFFLTILCMTFSVLGSLINPLIH